ncbi:MAG: HEPN domain-containing protein [Armatimonadota bacterium]|nr:HEPN domain-containing protein [Armatimonadota bacterium]
MATWRELSEDSLKAAEALLREGHYRSSVSRAYYSAYCVATHEIT